MFEIGLFHGVVHRILAPDENGDVVPFLGEMDLQIRRRHVKLACSWLAEITDEEDRHPEDRGSVTPSFSLGLPDYYYCKFWCNTAVNEPRMCVIIVLVLLFDTLAGSDLEIVIFRVQLVTWRIDTHEDDDSLTKDAHVASVTNVIDAGDYAAAEEAYELLSSSGIDVADAIAGAPTTRAPKRIFATITLVPQEGQDSSVNLEPCGRRDNQENSYHLQLLPYVGCLPTLCAIQCLTAAAATSSSMWRTCYYLVYVQFSTHFSRGEIMLPHNILLECCNIFHWH